MANSAVNMAKNFSKFDFAKILPTVFRINSPKKNHKITFIVLVENLNFTKSIFIKRIHDKNTFISIEILSKTYISLSVVSWPPQAMW
jgi:hypothetical protein